MEKLLQSAKTRPGADCGSDLKLKKVGKTSRPFKHDLNQIPYDYTVEVTNRFKELDLVDRVPEELWTEVHNIVLIRLDQISRSVVSDSLRPHGL